MIEISKVFLRSNEGRNRQLVREFAFCPAPFSIIPTEKGVSWKSKLSNKESNFRMCSLEIVRASESYFEVLIKSFPPPPEPTFDTNRRRRYLTSPQKTHFFHTSPTLLFSFFFLRYCSLGSQLEFLSSPNERLCIILAQFHHVRWT